MKHIWKSIPLFEIGVIETVEDYTTHTSFHEESYEPHPTSILELSRERDAFEKEMGLSRRVATSTLEEINIGMTSDPRLLSIVKELLPDQRDGMIALLKE